jgi:hypothetical protein
MGRTSRREQAVGDAHGLPLHEAAVQTVLALHQEAVAAVLDDATVVEYTAPRELGSRVCCLVQRPIG